MNWRPHQKRQWAGEPLKQWPKIDDDHYIVHLPGRPLETRFWSPNPRRNALPQPNARRRKFKTQFNRRPSVCEWQQFGNIFEIPRNSIRQTGRDEIRRWCGLLLNAPFEGATSHASNSLVGEQWSQQKTIRSSRSWLSARNAWPSQTSPLCHWMPRRYHKQVTLSFWIPKRISYRLVVNVNHRLCQPEEIQHFNESVDHKSNFRLLDFFNSISALLYGFFFQFHRTNFPIFHLSDVAVTLRITRMDT